MDLTLMKWNAVVDGDVVVFVVVCCMLWMSSLAKDLDENRKKGARPSLRRSSVDNTASVIVRVFGYG